MKEIEAEVDELTKQRDLANKHFRLRENHRLKDTRPHEIRRNEELPELGSEGNKQATSGERDDNLIPWKVRHEASGHEYIISGATLGDSNVGNSRYVQLHDTDGEGKIRSGLMIHFDPGDQEKNKRARQLVWAIIMVKPKTLTLES